MKTARNKSTGEHFIECPIELWQDAIEKLDKEKDSAIPMPMGHLMFKYPKDYNVDVFEVDDDEIKRAIGVRS